MTLLATSMISTRSLAQEELHIGTVGQRRSRPDGVGGLLLKSAGDTVFYEDFALGLTGNNGVGAWTRSGANGSIWKYDTDGPLGAYSSLNEVITSTTASNGFVIFDADRANCDTTVFPPAPFSAFTAWDGYLMSPVLDLSTTPEVHLTFQMRLRWCCGPAIGHFVDVSTDGGTTWLTRFDAPQSGHAFNDDPGTYSVDINLTPVIFNSPSAVRFRFSWAGSSINNSHYHWQIDDVTLTVSPDVGLEEEIATGDGMLISPNPCADMTMVSFDTPAGGTTEWTVLDLRGNTVMAGRSSAACFPILVDQLAAGAYVLHAQSSAAVCIRRLVVAR